MICFKRWSLTWIPKFTPDMNGIWWLYWAPSSVLGSLPKTWGIGLGSWDNEEAFLKQKPRRSYFGSLEWLSWLLPWWCYSAYHPIAGFSRFKYILVNMLCLGMWSPQLFCITRTPTTIQNTTTLPSLGPFFWFCPTLWTYLLTWLRLKPLYLSFPRFWSYARLLAFSTPSWLGLWPLWPSMPSFSPLFTWESTSGCSVTIRRIHLKSP